MVKNGNAPIVSKLEYNAAALITGAKIMRLKVANIATNIAIVAHSELDSNPDK